MRPHERHPPPCGIRAVLQPLNLKYTKSAPCRAASHRDLYAPKRIFSRNTALKSHGRRQPCRDFFLCLAEKSPSLECFAVLKQRFFLTRASRGRRNTLCISRTMDFLWGKRWFQNRMNPHVSPPNGCRLFFRTDLPAYNRCCRYRPRQLPGAGSSPPGPVRSMRRTSKNG